MDFQDLYAFYHVATEGSFSKAATRLHIAQSALSRRVARLEHILGVSLLQRHGRGVRLTEQGIALVDRAKSLMNELEQIERDILVLAEEPVGTVRVAMPPMTSQALGPLLVAQCRRRFPGIDLQLREGFSDLIQDWILEDKIDLGLLYNSGSDTDLRMLLLVDEPLFLLAPEQTQTLLPPPSEDLIDLSQLAILPLILPRRPHSLRLVLDRVAAQHGFTLNVAMEVEGIHATKGMVAAGLGYSIFGNLGSYEAINGQSLRAIPFRQKLSWQLALVQQQRTRTPRAFTEIERLIKEQINVLLQQGRWQGKTMVTAPR
jgi:LysR family transcriptional regulator, nitrogen assimilation regulatory protein